MGLRTARRPGLVALLGLALAWLGGGLPGLAVAAQDPGFAGSSSCRPCHEQFYGLWSTSRHGLAMQPYTDALGAGLLTPQTEDLVAGERRYRAFLGPGQGFVRETGPAGDVTDYPMVQVLGGKNVCYFLTPLERGRLQTLPVAYDVAAKAWFDTVASGQRLGPHAPGTGAARRESLDWRDPAYTFNTACHDCHVSQLSTNYDAATDTYHTIWREPGINCETCHGPSDAHNAVCAAAPRGTAPEDLKILRIGKDFTTAQRNDACAACHAKMAPITAGFVPGERFFDHFDLILLENADYSPDGRDLGENFTFTSWLSSPCAHSGRLDCIFCHTSSGRFRQAADPDQACLPCHQDKAAGRDKHTRHGADSPGARCISCHMPKTRFARMARSDHSMRPPAPAATARFGSPNACQGCHTDKDAAWAGGHVRQWRTRDYQASVLARATLIEQARRRDFSALPAMLDYLAASDHDAVLAASLVRLLRVCPDARTWPALRAALTDASPLVRASAAASLGENREPPTLAALAKACADPVRLVRIRAAEALAGVLPQALPPDGRRAVTDATAELIATFSVRADDWTGSYNRGNFLLRSGDPAGAIAAYATAARLRPDATAPLVNAAMAKARQNDLAGAEAALRKARELDPQSAAVAYNLGLVLAQRGQAGEAAEALRAAFTLDATLAEAAYNLGLLLRATDPAEARELLRQAAALRPDNPKYAKAAQPLDPAVPGSGAP
ncbi:ammonia-forming cytochrome c nitrite reductase subunit c552 [Desulfovibrio aerotolerans]|uniref:Ammonia-forming cytochrome c nitrite reductase subunit c552 n=1 Tax=Solidesulfovibrio aerotolerans TaxID=295255 RepID=A0A7C9IQ54_9BACT|nr:ammonia-forming cytochrome c nitrite reductase subunit c552 [Solidesulfovibrio aerotolerans]MYL85019.1 ammonia-forming cytochrome c nitrite reductase subunit c552 [Solidesulfovibrio aerotolerans]